MSDIKLNFVNQSNDQNNTEVVIFQKNIAPSYEELTVAWTVTANCAPGWSHPFNFPMQLTIAVSDSWGNYSPQLDAENGQLFSVVESPSGEMLQLTGTAASGTEIDIQNALRTGAIAANTYRDGRLLATKTGVEPGQTAVFAFWPTIWIGAVSQVVQGQVMNSAILSQVNTEISLIGIQSADIVMTGGGTGTSAQPYVFTLQNVV